MCKKNLLLKSVSQQQQKPCRNNPPDLSGFAALGGIKVTSSASLLTVQLSSSCTELEGWDGTCAVLSAGKNAINTWLMQNYGN